LFVYDVSHNRARVATRRFDQPYRLVKLAAAAC
jgi:hypothetical protein